MEKRKTYPWKKIKNEYLRGGCTLRQLRDKYGMSWSALSLRASKEHWVKLRDECKDKTEQRVTDAIAKGQARTEDRYQRLAELILQEIEDGIRDGSIGVTAKGWRDLTGALKDLREIQNGTSATDLDIEEQRARIAKLRADVAERQKTDADREIRVVIGSDLESLAQ